MGVDKTKPGAGRPDKDEGCAFEEIKIKEKIDDKDVETTLYKKDSNLYRKEYIVISGKEKKITFINKRNKEQCTLNATHNKINVNKNEIAYKNQCDVTVSFPYKVNLFSYLLLSEKDCEYYDVKLKSCKNAKNITLIVYPDIQWALAFSFGTSNPLGIKWKEWKRGGAKYTPPEVRQTAGKIGQDASAGKEVTIGFEFSVKRNDGKDESKLTAEYKHRFEELSALLKKCKDPMNTILSKTGGSISGVKAECVSPVVTLTGQWQFRKNEDSTKIGKLIEIEFQAKPFIGISATIDLLRAVAFAINPGAAQIVEYVKKALNSTKYVSGDIFINLKISGSIQGGLNASFCIIQGEDTKYKVAANLAAVISIELSAGVKIKGKIVLIFVEATAELNASISGKASFRFGAGLEYNNNGLYLIPQALFEGLTATAVFVFSAGFSTKKPKQNPNVGYEQKKDLVHKEKKWVLLQPFDFIKAIAGKEIKIALIDKENNNNNK